MTRKKKYTQTKDVSVIFIGKCIYKKTFSLNFLNTKLGISQMSLR